MGVRGRWAWPWVVVVAAAAVVGARTPSRGVNEIEAFVKRLEYEVRQGSGGEAVYQVEGGAQVDLNLLPDDVIVRQVEDGLDEEFDLVDEANGDKDEGKRKNTTDRAAEDRQRSLMYQGVYVPDGRFNAFVDGVMVNMVVEMKRRQMDPLYFRVYSRGIVEHVPIITGGSSSTTTTTTSSTTASPPSSSSFLPPSTSSTRKGRQRGNPIGGGVIRGLTNIKRFGNAEVQIAGNTTLVRGKWLTGPLDIVIDYRANPPRGRAVNRVRTGLAAVQLDGLTLVDRFGSEMEDFDIVSPLFDYMAYYGNRTAAQQDTTEKLLRHLLSDESFLLQILKESYRLASYDKIIPQFGADADYYEMLKYLFGGGGGGAGRGGGGGGDGDGGRVSFASLFASLPSSSPLSSLSSSSLSSSSSSSSFVSSPASSSLRLPYPPSFYLRSLSPSSSSSSSSSLPSSSSPVSSDSSPSSSSSDK